jgi:hypothetical protein
MFIIDNDTGPEYQSRSYEGFSLFWCCFDFSEGVFIKMPLVIQFKQL